MVLGKSKDYQKDSYNKNTFDEKKEDKDLLVTLKKYSNSKICGILKL
jgi:hypothetical protein